jgi:hypothetical protein
MYTNIPQQELRNIIYNALFNNNIHKDRITDIMNIVSTILNQNYFHHNNQTYKQQHLEHNNIQKTLMKHKVIDYYRYVDDILFVYNEKYTNINHMLTDFNNIHPNIQYTMETQIDNKLNYLDITIEIKNTPLHLISIENLQRQTKLYIIDHATQMNTNMQPYNICGTECKLTL